MPELPADPPHVRTTGAPRTKRPLLNKMFLTIVAATLLVSVAVAVHQLSRFRNTMNKEGCASNLRQLGQGLFMYANAHGGVYPPDLATMAANEDINGLPFFCDNDCPKELLNASGSALADAIRNSKNIAFTYVGAGVRPDAGPTVMIAYERPSRNHDGLNVLFADGHVECQTSVQFSDLMAHPTPDPSTAAVEK